MKRKDVIWNWLTENSSLRDTADFIEGFKGFEASDVAQALALDRANVSRDLNALVKEGLVLKTMSRPVYFFAKPALEGLSKGQLPSDGAIHDFIDVILGASQRETTLTETDVFGDMIGSRGSLQRSIKQAKSAVLYPPSGLHTLIIGDTGVGKSTFADKMYHYAQAMNRISATAEFVLFNCADYADNTQLLVSQLFGHIKGAFTGADHDKPGLIDRADGGVLFLDEIHRLSPEGQEMLFLLIDKGLYRRLGETEANRKASVLIIGATTEDTETVLLPTLLRRMPMTIKLPALSERPLNERKQLITTIFAEQRRLTKADIRVKKDALTALLFYDCPGNIGQLRGDIQLICAKEYLEYSTNHQNFIEVGIASLPDHIYQGLIKAKSSGYYHQNRDEQFHQDLYINSTTTNNPNFKSEDNPDSLIQKITERQEQLKQYGYTDESISKEINHLIDGYFKGLIEGHDLTANTYDENLTKIVKPSVMNAVTEALEMLEKDAGITISKTARVGLMLHIGALLEADPQTPRAAPDFAEIIPQNSSEWKLAEQFYLFLQEHLEEEIPASEIHFLAMLLFQHNPQPHSNILLLAIAHGNNTASSMAEVANSLLDTDVCLALDMPLDMSVEKVLEKTIDLITKQGDKKEVLLIVDMGSLTAFPGIIKNRIGVEVAALPMLSTPLLLEAARLIIPGSKSLGEIVSHLRTVNPYIGWMADEDITSEKRVVLTSCASGLGAAKKISTYLHKHLTQLAELGVELREVDASYHNQHDLHYEGMEVIAVVGTIRPKVKEEIPYIPFADIIGGAGIKQLESIIYGKQTGESKNDAISAEGERLMIIQALGEVLDFLDAEKIYSQLEECARPYAAALDLERDFQKRIRFIIHSACMIERLLTGSALPYKDVDIYLEENARLYTTLKSIFDNLEPIYNLTIPKTEYGYLTELVR